MFNLGDFKVGDVLDIAVSRLGLCVIGVLVDNSINIPLLELPSDGYNAASTMLHVG